MDGLQHVRNAIIGFCNRRDLFAKPQVCHGPGSYANSAGVASDPKNRSRQDLSGFWFRP